MHASGRIALAHAVLGVAAAVATGCATGASSLEHAAVAPRAAHGIAGGPPDGGATLSARDWQGISAFELEELMVGRFAGVSVTRGADGPLLQIRGASTIIGSSAPLIVVDGMPLPPGGSALVNPADVARIRVLKDVAETALYGVRGANGVVLVTTRRR